MDQVESHERISIRAQVYLINYEINFGFGRNSGLSQNNQIFISIITYDDNMVVEMYVLVHTIEVEI